MLRARGGPVTLRALAALLLLPAVSGAHENRPVLLDIQQAEGLHYRFTLRSPESILPVNRPVVRWPAGCEAIAASLLRCAGPLAGRPLGIHWPLYNPSVTTLVRYQSEGGAVASTVLAPGTASWEVPRAPSRAGVMRGYFGLGVGHILGGIDHLLFVAGLLLVARGFRSVLLAVSGFTLGHSITLSLAALGMVRVPVAPTEAAIALSLLYLAREALRPGEASLLRRLPMLVSSAFGLLHGLGFAAALGQTGLPQGEVTAALLFFNLGVEAGQLAFIAASLVAVALARRMLVRRGADPARIARTAQPVAAWLIGVPAAFWMWQRLPLQDIAALLR